MAEHAHGQHDARAAAEEGEEEERGLGHAAASAPGAGLVQGHEGEGVYIDEEQVGAQQDVEHIHLQLEQGKDVILEIEIQGARKIRQQFPDALLVFVTPPSAQELLRRLSGRGTETEEVIRARMRRAVQESEGMEDYDCILVNDELDACVSQLHSLIRSWHLRAKNNGDFIRQMKEELNYLQEIQ